jgi:hypothetical protein
MFLTTVTIYYSEFLLGIGLAIITLGIEYWYYKYKKPADDSRMVADNPMVRSIKRSSLILFKLI